MAPFPERRRGRPQPSRPRAPSRAAPSAAGPSEARLGCSRKQRVSSSPPSAHAPPPREHTGGHLHVVTRGSRGVPADRPMASLPGSLPGAACRGRRSPRHLHEKPRSSVARGVCGRPAEGTMKVAVTAQCTAQLRTSPPLSLSFRNRPRSPSHESASLPSVAAAGDKEQRGQGDGVLHFYFGDFGREPRRCRQHSRGRQTVLPAPFSHLALPRRPQGPRGIRMTSPLSTQT